MTFNKILILTIAFLLVISSACSDSADTNTKPNVNSANANIANAETNSPVAVTTPTPAVTTNQAETIKPVVMAYYEALKTKNEAALRKVYSSDTLESLEKDMKSEGKKSLVQFVTETDPVPDKPFEVRNEQINGDVAVAEIRGGSYPNGIRIQFVKENGEWKMTNINPDFEKPKK